ncbi:MAG TPA: hypothetical protein PLB01_15280 [Thermoanaerobaculia bacterium]|nr:hypothetical protein [Thermoanaerobaculia bacterium]
MAVVASMRSRIAALVGALLWSLGTIVLPALHLARHARPHDHEGGGIHYHLDAEAYHDGHDDHDDDDEPGGPFTVEAPHGRRHAPHAAGLAHFAAATGEGAAVVLAFTSEPDPERVPDALPGRCAEYFLEGQKAARAPPPA